MLVVPINEAEAMIEPFWDGGSSEQPDDKHAVLSEYRTSIARQARGRIKQGWCAVEVVIDKAPAGAMVAVLERDCDASLNGYDVFRVFASLPHWAHMTVRATIDGEVRVLLNAIAGGDTHDEFDGVFTGEHLSHLRIEFSLDEDRPTYIELLWLGLANAASQRRMEARRSPYHAEWRGLLSEKPLKLQPELGLFFDAPQLLELRRKVQRGPIKLIYERMRQQAAQDAQTYAQPEADIGFFVPNPDRRWVRNRDLARKCTAGVMERLAFVGLLEQDAALSRLAARMALSAAHCDTWCESIMGIFPGATWHHRSFTEEIYCRACALVLDWAGAQLTAHGKQVIRDAIIMKGLPRIESDFKRMEYIRHMNQGIVFSSGRIVGLLGVLPAHPRYASQVAEAERDLGEMIDSYVQPDGGTLEGMAYWNYTFSTAMPLYYALARYHGCADLRGYREIGGLPASLVRTGDYALGMLSTSGDGATYLPINDAHADESINPALIAAYAQISERTEWQRLYAATVQTGAHGEDLYHIIFAPPQTEDSGPLIAPRFSVMPNVGEVSAVRADANLGHTHFHLSCGPILMTHYHQDRGSFILEAAGEVLAMDRGVTTYDHPEVGLIGAAHRHNLLYPESHDGRLVRQPPQAEGGRLTSALLEAGVMMLACDNTLAWEEGVFTSSERRVYSPTPDLYLIDDEARMAARPGVPPFGVSFRLNTRCKIELNEGEYRVLGERATLRVVPLNWTPDEASQGVEGINSHLQPVAMLRLYSKPATHYRLLTAIEVLPANPAQAIEGWRFEHGHAITVARTGQKVRLSLAQKPSLLVTLDVAGAPSLVAVCQDGRWELNR